MKCLKRCPLILDTLGPEEVFSRFPEMTEEDKKSFRSKYYTGVQHVSEILYTMGIVDRFSPEQ